MQGQALPGFRDFYPEELALRNYIFATWRDVARRYGFQEYDGPPLEPLELYTGKSGEEIVQQLYAFQDKGERQVALRPEMTPTLARMVGARAQALKKPIRWFSIPQLFRYERQQRGRLREHFQLNMDVIGEAGPAAPAEIMAARSRTARGFRADPGGGAPRGAAPPALGRRPRKRAPGAGRGIVRGLAYYTGLVFELFDAKRSLRAICGGGRYDSLIQEIAGVDLPCVGFGMGDVVLGELLKEHGKAAEAPSRLDAFLIAVGGEDVAPVLKLAHELRDRGIAVEYALRDAPVGKQLELAVARGAPRAVIVGPDERKAKVAVVRDLKSGRQRKVAMTKVRKGVFK